MKLALTNKTNNGYVKCGRKCDSSKNFVKQF